MVLSGASRGRGMAGALGKLNVGFVGCGRIADLHVPGYEDNPHARLLAICDTSSDVLESRRRQWGVDRTYRDFAEMLADPDIDAVEILTPQKLHESQTVAALRAGKHVALQKPLSTDLASADRILAAVSASDRVFKVTENYVFYPPLVLVRKLLAEGAIGDPVSLRIQFISGPEGGWQVPAEAWQWRMQEAREGRGPSTFDHGHHLWSTAWFLMGEPERVTGWVDSNDGLVDCPSQFLWKYRDGKRYGCCLFHHGDHLRVPSRYYSNDEWIEVFGSRGILQVRRCTGNVQDGPPVRLWDGQLFRDWADVDADWGQGFVGATRDFVRAVRDGATPTLTGEQARLVLRFSLALQKASRVRREVWVDELDAAWPALDAWRRTRRSRKEAATGSEGWFSRLTGGTSKYAGQAVGLTESMVSRFVPGEPPLPDTSIGLVLQGDGLPEQRLGLVIRDNRATLLQGELPAEAALVVTMAPGVWAAILLKKKRIEFAVLQGKIRYSGRVEEALKLRSAFDL